MSILFAFLDSELLTRRNASPRLSVRRDFDLLPLGISDGTLTMPVTGKMDSDQTARTPLKLRKASPFVSRRLTRSLARKLRQASTQLADLEKTAERGELEQLDAQKREPVGVQSPGLALGSPPALEGSPVGAVKNEIVSSTSSHTPVIPGHSAMKGRAAAYLRSLCSRCGVVADLHPYRDPSGKALCQECNRSVSEAEKEHEAMVS